MTHRLAPLAAALLAVAPLAGSAHAEDDSAARVEGLAGWRAERVHDQGDVGIWVVAGLPALPTVGSDVVVSLDDEGRLRMHIPYSGRWATIDCLSDGEWLNGLAFGDLDAQAPGREVYTGGKRGDLWEVVVHPHGALEGRLVAHLQGEEIQCLVLDDLDPARPGDELLVFAWPGNVHLVTRSDEGPAIRLLGTPPSRVRDAVVLPARPGTAPEIVLGTRGGELLVARLAGERLEVEVAHRVRTGIGRLALRAGEPDAATVVYAACDDGRVLRLERARDGAWAEELVYAGPVGGRGVVSGRFDADPAKESIAVFGYSGQVELLTRAGEGWTVETIFRDRDRGHWLTKLEYDGRNATDELACAGYGGRVVALARPPGYGLPGVLAHREETAAADAFRIGWGTARRREAALTPHVYFGGFRAKTLVYETLVRAGPDGRPAPSLAAAWERGDGGRRFTFELRPGARFHDGSACDAAAVVDHFERVLGNPEHAWLGMSSRVVSVRALDDAHVEFVLREPYPLPLDLMAVNPCSVAAASAAPGADRFAPVGTGPFRVVEEQPGAATVLERVAEPHDRVVLRHLEGGDTRSRSHVRALEAGDVDAIADEWLPQIPRDDVAVLAGDAAYEVLRAPGSVVFHLAFAPGRPPFDSLEARRRLGASIDRAALVEEVERGFGVPCETLFAPAVADWPSERVTAPGPASAGGPPLRARLPVADFEGDRIRLALALARQARAVGIEIEVEVLDRAALLDRLQSGDYELRLSSTHGIPYDPHMWLVAHAQALPGVDEPLRASFAAADDGARSAAWREIQAVVERDVLLLPLYVPDRIAVVRRGRGRVGIGPNGYTIDIGR